jgi:hypothetical protein
MGFASIPQETAAANLNRVAVSLRAALLPRQWKVGTRTNFSVLHLVARSELKLLSPYSETGPEPHQRSDEASIHSLTARASVLRVSLKYLGAKSFES